MSNQKSKLSYARHQMAAAQAYSFAIQAKNMRHRIGNNALLHDVLTFLVLSGLSIELYFKSIMIIAKKGEDTKGHDLKKLYADIPDSVRKCLSKNYLSQITKVSLQYMQYATIAKEEQLEVPNRDAPNTKYDTFENAIISISNIFTRSRYFYEEVNKNDYAYIECPMGQIEALIASLNNTCRSYSNNKFSRTLVK